MRARTVGYIVAALSPFWLLALIAIQGRFFVSPYVEVEYGTDASNKIFKYAHIIRYTSLQEKNLDKLDKRALNDVASRWIRQYQDKVLTDILPISPEDDGTIGFRGEIEAHRRRVISTLNRDMLQQIEEGNYELAAERIMQVAEIANIAKYNSAYSSFFASTAQSFAIKQFETIQPKLENDQRQNVYRALDRIVTNPELIKHTAERLSVVSSRRLTDDAVQFPAKGEMTLILNTTAREFPIQTTEDTIGILQAESYRIAYQQELRLESELNRNRLTASRTN